MRKERKAERKKKEREVEEKEACIIDVCVLLYFVECVCGGKAAMGDVIVP